MGKLYVGFAAKCYFTCIFEIYAVCSRGVTGTVIALSLKDCTDVEALGIISVMCSYEKL
jgi:hypothetical protein